MTAAVLALLLAGCPHTPRAELAHDAALLVEMGQRYDVPPLLAAAVEIRESTCRRNARSAGGLDFGKMQIRRGVTTGPHAFTDAQLLESRRNIRMGVRRLARARQNCGAAPANEWLGGYAGLRCGQSRYADRVLATAASAGRLVAR